MARRDEERRERAAILHSLVPPNEGSELLLTVTTEREGGREEGEMGVKSFPPPMMFAFAEFARSLLRPDALPPSFSLPPSLFLPPSANGKSASRGIVQQCRNLRHLRRRGRTRPRSRSPIAHMGAETSLVHYGCNELRVRRSAG